MHQQRPIKLESAHGKAKLPPGLDALGLGLATGTVLTLLVVGIGWALTLLGS